MRIVFIIIGAASVLFVFAGVVASLIVAGIESRREEKP